MFEKIVLGLLLVVVVSLPVLALDEREIDALITLNSSFPSLLSVNALDEYDADYVYYGNSWNSKSASEVCNGRAGWDLHGIYCGSTGHIEKIRFTNSWGLAAPLFPALELPYLKEFATRSPPYIGISALRFESSCARLLESLSPSTLAGLEKLDIPRWSNEINHFPLGIMHQLRAMRNLTLFCPNGASALSLGHLSQLEYVRFTRSVPDSLPDFSLFVASNTTLREIYLEYVSVNNHDMLINFTVLQTAHIRAGSGWNTPMHLPPSLLSLQSGYWPIGPISLISDTLQSLRLDNPLFDGFTDISLPSSLQSLSVSYMTNSMTWPSKLPASLRSLTLKNPGAEIVKFVPGLFDDCTDLHTLEITDVVNPIWEGFPSFSTTSLEKLVLTKVTGNLETGRIICDMPPSSMKHINLDQTKFGRFPDCISQYTGLETLRLINSFTGFLIFPEIFENITAPNLVELAFDARPFNGQNPDWPAVIAQFPKLQKIEFTSPNSPAIISSFPLDALMSLTNLTYLSLRNTKLNGTLPTDWFTNHSKLEYLDLFNHRLSGTIPTAGWSKLKIVDLSSGLFTDFPYIEWPGAPELESFKLNDNHLTSIPSDSVFSAMSKLKSLYIGSNPSLGGPLPLFWSHRTSRLHILSAASSGFSGSIPSIESPSIRLLSISGNNLCGSLPEVPRSVALGSFSANDNSFQGSVPTSWSSHLTVYTSLVLRSTYLQGTLPNPLLDPVSRYSLLSLDFDNTYLSGPFINLTGYESLSAIFFTGPNMRMDACAADPTPDTSPLGCTIPPLFGCECDEYYQWCNRGGAACPSTPLEPVVLEPGTVAPYSEAVAPPNVACPVPDPRQEPPSSSPSYPPHTVTDNCPLPSPGTSFTCINSVWTASGSISIPTLTISPGSVVVVEGNLTISTGTIQIGSIGVTIQIEGCLFFEGDGEIIITLTEEDMELLEKEKGSEVVKILIQSDGECAGGTDLSMVKVDTKVAKESCKKVKTKKDTQTNRGTLALAFQLDSSKCNRWWIILVSVLGGIVVIIVVVILLVSFNPTCRDKVKPFWRR